MKSICFKAFWQSTIIFVFLVVSVLLFKYYLYIQEPRLQPITTINYQYGTNQIKSSNKKQKQIMSKCQPKNHIMYLKTHKTASTSLMNLIVRYGLKNNLYFALPPHKQIALKLEQQINFKKNMIPKILLPSNGLVDIFAIHVRLNRKELSKLLHSDTIWITILREPVAQFISQFYYFHFNKLFKQNLQNLMKRKCEEIRQNISNRMSFDLGLSRKLENKVTLMSKMKRLDSIFDLVLIVEKLEESLILLKEKLCWTFDDIVMIKKLRYVSTKRNISDEVKNNIRNCSKADVFLNNYFLEKHNKEVEKFGRIEMEREVAFLKEKVFNYSNLCLQRETKHLSDIERLQLLNINCEIAESLPEKYIPILRKKQLSTV